MKFPIVEPPETINCPHIQISNKLLEEVKNADADKTGPTDK
jgi:hypothetical protein